MSVRFWAFSSLQLYAEKNISEMCQMKFWYIKTHNKALPTQQKWVVGGFPYRVQCFGHMEYDINETVEYEGIGREIISYTIDITYAVHMLG